MTRTQLAAFGVSRRGVEHRVSRGRLHRVHRGVYAVGRPELTKYGTWMAAVLACGPDAALSHASAGALFEIAKSDGTLHVTVPGSSALRHAGITIHRRDLDPTEKGSYEGIPTTSPAATLIDLAASISLPRLERAVNDADKLGLVRAYELPALLARFPRRPGLRTLRSLVSRDTFRLTDSDLERRFLALVGRAGLPTPQTGTHLNGFKTDFYWPQFRLVVETDGLTYHRTPAQQARDRHRDQAHIRARLTPLRFTHHQIAHEPGEVIATLKSAARLRTP